MHAKSFAHLFRGLDRAFGRYTLADGDAGKSEKVKGKATTVQQQVSLDLYEWHLSGSQGLGIVPIDDAANSYFGAIDIDQYDVDIAGLEAQLAALGLPLVPCRSKSGGVHLYLFAPGGIPARIMSSTLSTWAGALGYPRTEIFPKQIKLASDRDVGNWINLPYFDAGNTQRYAIYNGKPLSLAQFITRAQQCAVDVELLEKIVIPDIDGLEEAPPCLVSLARSGFPHGSRNHALFDLGVYAKMRYPDEWEQKVDEFNRRFMSPGSSEEVVNIIKSLRRKDYFYKCTDLPICDYCNKAVCRTRRYGVGQNDQEWNITVDSACQKITTEPPYWIISIEGVRIELTAQDLLTQQRFRKRCVECIDKVPTMMKAGAWDKLVQGILDNAEVIEAPSDASIMGQLAYYVEQFCTQKAQARNKDEILSGKPWVDGGRVYFRSGDLQKFLEQQYFREMDKRQIYAGLRRMGVKHHQINARGRCVQCWSVPEYEVPEYQDTPNRVDLGGM